MPCLDCQSQFILPLIKLVGQSAKLCCGSLIYGGGKYRLTVFGVYGLSSYDCVSCVCKLKGQVIHLELLTVDGLSGQCTVPSWYPIDLVMPIIISGHLSSIWYPSMMVAKIAIIIEGSILFGIALMMRLNCSSVMRLPYLLIDNIIDNPCNLKEISKFFVRVFVWAFSESIVCCVIQNFQVFFVIGHFILLLDYFGRQLF